MAIGFEAFCVVSLEVNPITKKLKGRTKNRSVGVFGVLLADIILYKRTFDSLYFIHTEGLKLMRARITKS